MKNNPKTIKELKLILEKADIPKSYYDVPCNNNFFCDTVTYLKVKSADCYEVGVFERGGFHDIYKFGTEAEACQAFLEEFYPEVLNGEK